MYLNNDNRRQPKFRLLLMEDDEGYRDMKNKPHRRNRRGRYSYNDYDDYDYDDYDYNDYDDDEVSTFTFLVEADDDDNDEEDEQTEGGQTNVEYDENGLPKDTFEPVADCVLDKGGLCIVKKDKIATEYDYTDKEGNHLKGEDKYIQAYLTAKGCTNAAKVQQVQQKPEQLVQVLLELGGCPGGATQENKIYGKASKSWIQVINYSISQFSGDYGYSFKRNSFLEFVSKISKANNSLITKEVSVNNLMNLYNLVKDGDIDSKNEVQTALFSREEMYKYRDTQTVWKLIADFTSNDADRYYDEDEIDSMRASKLNSDVLKKILATKGNDAETIKVINSLEVTDTQRRNNARRITQEDTEEIENVRKNTTNYIKTDLQQQLKDIQTLGDDDWKQIIANAKLTDYDTRNKEELLGKILSAYVQYIKTKGRNKTTATNKQTTNKQTTTKQNTETETANGNNAKQQTAKTAV